VPFLRGADAFFAGAARWTGDASRTARFLHGRARFAGRDDDIFVSSYPRSGTTWTLAMAHLLVSGADGFDFAHQSDATPWWERTLAWRTDAPGQWDTLPSPRVFKTHLPKRWLPSQGRYLYAFRNPEDVAVSYYHLYRRYLGFRGGFGAFFDRFLAGDLQYRSWFRHVAGWEAERGNPRVLWVGYEESLADPVAAIRRIAAFLEIEIDPARAARIAELTHFSRMKAQEAKFAHEGELLRQWGIREEGFRESGFLREGRAAQGGEALTREQRERLARAREAALPFPGFEWRIPAFLH
jgi:hypothetical protein